MPASSTAATSRSVTRDLVVVWVVGLLVAAGLGLSTAFVRPEPFWLVFGVFTACSLGPCIGLAWLTVGAGRKAEIDRRADENVETRWFEKAASGALFDVLMAVGFLLGAMSLFGFDPETEAVLIGLWFFAILNGALRFLVIRRRES